jgi:hypothetical protein
LRDGLILSVFGVERGDEVAATKELIARKAEVDPRLLADADSDLVALAEAYAEVASP